MNLHTNLDLTSFMAELGRIDEAKVYFAQATTIFESLGDVEKKKIICDGEGQSIVYENRRNDFELLLRI